MSSEELWLKISKLAQDRNLTISELAQQAGVSRTNLYNIKKGVSKNPSFFMIVKIADVLGVSLDELRK
ncbi:helix-turn-helix domain-containing protein [Secundilactobacillus kimchicus]|uniref:helix-turn-helix domain-containing protein n=1 Tax=Secundilactobacillus kimchicus TaxID=528209 RepID=UPI0024A99064|nr:helix-turn-helix transcriptional regulator [Secundilactobacillus kimchicus]